LIEGRQFERTLILADTSAADSYVIDVFRVAGGVEHTKFLHGHFGRLATQGLTPVSTDQSPFGEVMRGFKRDPQPSAGWRVDWSIEDRLKCLPRPADVHLRYTDLTRDVAVEIAEAWVAVGLFGGTADAWIPSVLIRRRTAQPPLASTFVGILEPYEGEPRLGVIRRLKLEDSDGAACSDAHVGIEVRLPGGGRDIFIALNVEAGSTDHPTPVIEKENGLWFDGDLCLVRIADSKQAKQVLLCRGRSLRAGELFVQAKDEEACLEIDLRDAANPIVAGPAGAVSIIEVAGKRLWPR
jgi:hypothetical protein